MKTSEIRRALLRRWPATLLVVVAAIALAVVMHGQLSSVPTGQATTQILVDSQSSALVNVNTNSVGLTAQASVLAQALTSEAVLQDIAKSAGVNVGELSAQGPFNGAGETLDVPTPSEARSMQVVSAGAAYHIAFVAQQNVPVITVTVKGPDPRAAGHIANAVLPGAQAWLSTVAATSTLPKSRQLVLRQLGDAQSGPVNSKAAIEIAAMLAIAILLLGLLAVTLLDRRLTVRGELRRRRQTELGDLERALQGDRGAAADIGEHHRSADVVTAIGSDLETAVAGTDLETADGADLPTADAADGTDLETGDTLEAAAIDDHHGGARDAEPALADRNREAELAGLLAAVAGKPARDPRHSKKNGNGRR